MNNNLHRLIALKKKISASLPLSSVNDWRGFDLTENGKILAHKIVEFNGMDLDVIASFDSSKEWYDVANFLKLLLKYRKLLASLTDKEFDDFIRKLETDDFANTV